MSELSLGKEIRGLREKLGVSLRKFSELVGTSAAHMSDIEHGRRAPSKELLARIARELASVGGSLELLESRDPRLEPELQEWVEQNPEVRQLLRTAHDSKRPLPDLLEAMRREARRGK